MAAVVLRTYSDGLEVERPRNYRWLAAAALVTAPTAALLASPLESAWVPLAVVLSAVVPGLWVLALRGAGRQVVRLRREGARVFCNGAELEVARVETRVVLSLVFRVPRAYQLSLWGLTVEGRALEVGVGEVKDLLSASQLSGALEDFLAEPAALRPVRMR